MEQSFVFERLHKPLDIHRILKMSDMEMLDRKNLIQLSKELSTSHISTTESDQEFGKAIQLIQYSLQYLQYSCKHLKTKKDTVTVNTKILKDENKALDLKLSILKAKQKVLLEEVKFYDDIENRLYGSLVALDSKVARSYVSVQETNTARSDRLDQMTYNHQKSIQTPSPEIIESTAESLVSSDLGTEHPPITPTKLNIRKLKEADMLVVAKQDIPDKQNIQMYVNPEEVISTPITPRQQLQLNVDEVVAMLMEEVDQENITTNRESNILFSDAFDVLPPTESSDSVNNSEQEYLFEKEPIQVPIRNIINMHESTVPSQNPFLPTFSAKELFESPLGTTASKTSTVEDDSKIIEKFDNLSMFAEEKSSYSEHSYHSQSKSEFPILQAKENKCGIYSIDRAPRDYSDDEFYADDLSQDSISDKCCESKTIEEKIREIY